MVRGAGQVAIRQRENGFRHKFERYIAKDRDNPDLRRKALTAITAKMARVVHGSYYRPFVEGTGTRWKNRFLRSREGAQGVTPGLPPGSEARVEDGEGP